VSVDWVALSAQTAAFDVLDCQTDPGGRTTDVVAVGLRVKLSEVAGRFTAGHASSLLVYADTLDVDVAVLPAPFCVIVARSVSGRGSLGLPAPDTAHETVAAEVLTGSALTLVAGDGRQFAVGQARVPTACTVTHELGHDPQAAMAADAATIGDLTGRPYALNALQATFSAATRLAETTEGRPTAREMLAWITQLTTPATGTATDPTPWTDLYRQAQPLLIMLMVQPGASYVPALSSSYYQSQLMTLLDTLDSYDASLNTLATSSDITKAVAAVAATTTATAADELRPLQAELASLNANLEDLNTGINTLNLQFQMQSSAVDAAYAKLKAALTDAQIEAWFSACISTGISAIKVGFDASKIVATGGADVGAWKGAVTESVGMAQAAVTAIQDVAKDVTTSQQKLVDAAAKLVTMQQQLVMAYASAQTIRASSELKAAPSLFAIDPATAWDNYLAQVGSSLGSVPQGGKLLVTLTTLANYGKAMAAKIAVATGQCAQRTIVESRIAATKSVAARWTDLSDSAKSDFERRAALAGLVSGRRGDVVRTLFTAWMNYRAAFTYVYLAEPGVTVTLDMTTAELREAFADTSDWVGRVTGDSSGSPIVLPDTGVTVPLSFRIVGPSDEVDFDTALYAPRAGGQLPVLTWTIPWGSDQLAGVLPHDVAVWITAARFWIDGVSPNDRHRVLVKVATSGSYRNGFGHNTLTTFVSRSMTGNYAYKVGSEADPYNPWTVPSEVTMIPTPFTQWTMTFDADGGDAKAATTLHMECTVTYRRAS
jgi:hypothetical protein